MSDQEQEKSLDSIFNRKYTEFCDDLIGAYPEKTAEINQARALTEPERMARFRTEVMPVAGRPDRNPLETPGVVLPGVMIEPPHWSVFSDNTKKAIQEYVTLLSFCCMFGDAEHPWATDLSGGASRVWVDEMLKHWKTKLNSVDFKSLTEKIMNIFGSAGGASAFKIPERLLKGQLAKLADELVREFKPEDFGLSPEQLEETERNPSRAFELLVNIYTQKPEILQNAMKRIAKRLQDKVRRGELKPQELAAEAEEMMKEFSENPAFVELMEGFRSAFGFEDMDTARQAGREGDARLALARARLRAKAEKKKAETQAQQQQTQQAQGGAGSIQAPNIDDLMRTMGFKPNEMGSSSKKKDEKGGKRRK
jgi:hypothetical protein